MFGLNLHSINISMLPWDLYALSNDRILAPGNLQLDVDNCSGLCISSVWDSGDFTDGHCNILLAVSPAS